MDNEQDTSPLVKAETAANAMSKPVKFACLMAALHGGYAMFPAGYKLARQWTYVAPLCGTIGWLAQTAINYPEIKRLLARQDVSIREKLIWLIPAGIATLPIVLTADESAQSYASDQVANTVVLYSCGLGIALTYTNVAINLKQHCKRPSSFSHQQIIPSLWALLSGTTGFALLIRKLPQKIDHHAPALATIALPMSTLLALGVAFFRTSLIYPAISDIYKKIAASNRCQTMKQQATIKQAFIVTGAIVAAMTFEQMMDIGLGHPTAPLGLLAKWTYIVLALVGITTLASVSFNKASREVYTDFLKRGHNSLYRLPLPAADNPQAAAYIAAPSLDRPGPTAGK